MKHAFSQNRLLLPKENDNPFVSIKHADKGEITLSNLINEEYVTCNTLVREKGKRVTRLSIDRNILNSKIP